MNGIENISILVDIVKTDAFVQIVVLCMIAVFIWFFIDCVGHLISVGRKFHNAADLILKVENGGTEVIKSLEDYFKQDTVALHCLKEYEESLYRRTEILDSGEVRTTQFQLSEPAASFFDVASLIENPAKINFFNHLPGLFTSFGIIGTFFGLIIGLQAFSLDTSHVESIQRGVTGLLGSVMHAFVISATAIILALLTTFFEKLFYQKALSQLNVFLSNLDSKFVGGVSNDFMAKLLDLTEQNTTQTKQIMDGFITDLKELLTRNSEDQSRRISNAIVETFSGSLDRVSNAMNDTNRIMDTLDKYVSSSQKAAGEVTEKVANDICSVIKVMRDEMDDFKTAISDSALKLTTATEKLENVTGNYSNAVYQVGENSKQQIDELIGSMKAVVEQVSTQYTELNSKLTNAFKEQVLTSQENIQNVTDKTQNVISELNLTVENINSTLNATVEKLSTETEKHALGMEKSTKKVFDGFLLTISNLNDELAKTFDSIKVCQTQIGRIVTKVNDVATSLSSSAEQSQDVANEFSNAMELQSQNLSELNTIIANFTESLSQSDEMIQKIDDVINKIQTSNQETEDFAQKAADNLSKVFNEFQSGTKRVGIEVCSQLDGLMQTAYTKLDSSINELNGTLEDFSEEIGKNTRSKKK